ncbi:MAG: acyltransferase family protein [Alphaproteobacteria bacterium]|nr:acyltransferase family protein [Alphaproteobacteria bacterium]
MKTSHIKALDGLRAIAIILVFLRHSTNPFSKAGYDFSVYGYDFFTPFLNGWIGVDLFFVLSGFLITKSFMQNRDQPHFLKRYALKRIYRIVPTYYVALLLCAVFVFVSGQLALEPLFWSFLYHLLFLQDYFPANINVVFWSLGVEEKFYIAAFFCLPLLFGLQKKYGNLLFCSFCLLILLASICLRVGYFNLHASTNTYENFFFYARAPFHGCLDALPFGVMIAVLQFDGNKIVKLPARLIFNISALGLALILCLDAMLSNITWYDLTLQPFIIAVVMAGLVFAAVHGGGYAWLETRFMRHISVLSYALYLVHYPLGGFALWITRSYGFENFEIIFPVFFVHYVVISYGAALLLHYAVERPFLKLKDRL